MAHIASISIGPTTCLSPDGITTTHTLIFTPKGLIPSEIKELATREDITTAQQIAWWESVVVKRAPKFSAKPRLAHCTGLVSEWSLVSINGRWSIQLEVWTLGSDRKSSILLPKDRSPQDVLDQLDGLLVASTVVCKGGANVLA